jgi:hypothetical protein
MGWVRCHKRYGGFLAIAALALQIVLSFGHVHLDGIRSPAAHSAVATQHKPAMLQASRQIPAQHPGDDDYCAICASISLASTSLISLPPPLPVPLGFVRIALRFGATQGIAAPRRVAFQSRAPPAA